MAATPPQTLVTYGVCYCADTQRDTMLLALWDVISQGGACFPPDAPVATAATNITSDGFDANWNAVSGATSYEFDISEFANFSILFFTGDVGNVTTLPFSPILDPDTTYYYRVRAVNACGTSSNSNVIEATTDPVGGGNLILDDGVNPPTIYNDPTGPYDFTEGPWVTVTATDCTNLTGLNFTGNVDLASLVMTNCPALVSLIVTHSTGLTELDLTGLPTNLGLIVTVQNCALLTSIDLSQAVTMGSLTLVDNEVLDTLDISNLVSLSGNLICSASLTTATADWSSIESIGGNFTFTLNGVQFFNLGECVTIGGNCLFSNGGNLATIDLGSLEGVTGNFTVSDNNSLGTWDLSLLETVGGNFLINQNAILVTVSAPALTAVTGDLEIDGMDSMAHLAFAELASVGGTLIITNNPVLDDINVGVLVTAGGVDVEDNLILSFLSFTLLETVTGDFFVQNNTVLAALIVQFLETASNFTVVGSDAITTLSCPALLTVSDSITVQNNILLDTFTLPVLTTTTVLVLSDSLVTSLTLPSLASSISIAIQVDNNINLVTFSMNGQALTNAGSYNFVENALSEASVDLVLAAGIAASPAMTSGDISLDGGSNEPPSATGATNAGILSTAGVTVTTN